MALRYRVLGEELVGEGGFLRLRRLRVELVRDDGTHTSEGLYDFVERPCGLDAVVLLLWHRRAAGDVEVLLRSGLRVPFDFGRPEGRQVVARLFPEVVAGIIERGEESEAALKARAAQEAYEEAGITVSADSIERLGAPLYPSIGLTPEQFHFFACQVSDLARQTAHPPPGDGSPFEEGAELLWKPLGDALGACARGEIADMKTEIALRRLAEQMEGVLARE